MNSIRTFLIIVWDLTLKGIKVRYNKSYLNFLFSLIQPILGMAVYAIVFWRIGHFYSENIPYPLFNFVGLAPWGFLALSLNYSAGSLLANYNLITRIQFPRAALPVSTILIQLILFLLNLVFLSVLMIYFRVPFTPYALWALPVFAVQVILMVGMSLFFSVVITYFRSTRNLLPAMTQLWMYGSPVFYSIRVIGKKYMGFYKLNPMTGIIDGYRAAILHHQAPSMETLLPALGVSAAVFVAGCLLFRKFEKNIADIV